MNRSLLREVINNIVAHKIAEANSKGGKYGYVIANKDSDDPTLQLTGYGNMSSTAWKRKILEDLKKLINDVENDNWGNAKKAVELNGVLHSSINMMAETFVEDINEIGEMSQQSEQSPAEPTTTDDTENQTDPKDIKKQQELTDLKKKQTQLNDKIRNNDAAKQKLEDPIRRKIQDLDRKKAPLVKQLGSLTKQIQDLESQ